MMETAGASNPLQIKLEGFLRTINLDGKFTCLEISNKTGKRCGRTRSKATREEFAVLLMRIVELLKEDGKGVEALLVEASSLVMCFPCHQDQAATKFKEWRENPT
jgi:hypothetical protein